MALQHFDIPGHGSISGHACSCFPSASSHLPRLQVLVRLFMETDTPQVWAHPDQASHSSQTATSEEGELYKLHAIIGRQQR